MMAKLTDTQLIVLSKAVQREDGAAVVPKAMGKAPAAKVAASLITRKLMREVRTKDGMPVWRTDDEGRDYSLVILRAGRDAIRVEEGDADKIVATPSSASTSASTQGRASSTRKSRDVGPSAFPPSTASSTAPRAGSKQAEVIEMLLRKNGATIAELVEATQWLAHTTRAVLTGLRKRGYVLDRQRHDDVTRYRITASPTLAKAA